jgi:serine/threonine protein kinase
MPLNCHFPVILAVHCFTVERRLAIAIPSVASSSVFGCTRSSGQKVRLNPTEKTLIASGVANGMAYLHRANTVHRRLKSLKVLLDGRLFPFVCNFGIARTLQGRNAMTIGCGTTFWMAPEQMDSRHHDFKVDVRAFGMVLHDLLCEEVPFEGRHPAQVCRGVRPTVPSSGDSRIRSRIRVCWQQDHQARPTFEPIFNQSIGGKSGWDGTNPNALVMKKLIADNTYVLQKKKKQKQRY